MNVHRKESLRLLRKMCRYVTEDVLQELCDESSNVLDTSTSSAQQQVQPHPPFQAQISELLVVVLENDDDMESQLSGLTILQELLSKYGVAFDEQFVRLGLPNKIALLAGPGDEEEGEGEKVKGEGEKAEAEATNEDQGEKDSPDGVVESSVDPKTSADSGKEGGEEEGGEEKQAAVEAEDAAEILVHTPYRWREWSAVRSRDCLYLWNGFCAIELSTISNGWFRFLLDNKLATMYSSGSTEGGAGSFGEWCSVDIPSLSLQRACGACDLHVLLSQHRFSLVLTSVTFRPQRTVLNFLRSCSECVPRSLVEHSLSPSCLRQAQRGWWWVTGASPAREKERWPCTTLMGTE